MSTPNREVAQLNVKIDADLKRRFDALLEVKGWSQREVIERMIEAHVASNEGLNILHLDGSVCPMSKLILNIEEAVCSQIRNR